MSGINDKGDFENMRSLSEVDSLSSKRKQTISNELLHFLISLQGSDQLINPTKFVTQNQLLNLDNRIFDEENEEQNLNEDSSLERGSFMKRIEEELDENKRSVTENIKNGEFEVQGTKQDTLPWQYLLISKEQ